MRYVTIEGTELQVSRWSLGTGSLHHLFSARQRLKLLGCAADAGFTHIDTSPIYGSGLAEIDLGKFLRGRRDQFTIATKVGLYPRGGTTHTATALWARRVIGKLVRKHGIARANWHAGMAARSLDASLRRMRIDRADLLLLHEPDPEAINADEFLGWLEREVERGRIRNWGLAGTGVTQLPWAANGHPLAQVLQTSDSWREPLNVAQGRASRSAQFTYGCLSGLRKQDTPIDVPTALAAALRRNVHGSIIISTRQPGHLKAFVRAAEAEVCA